MRIGPWLFAVFALGCVREPGEWVCPEGVSEGDLVVTEIGAAYFEIYNAQGGTVPLAGLALELVRLDGGEQVRVLVRDQALSVAGGGYAVVAAEGVYGSGAADVLACGVLTDRVIWRDRPSTGSKTFDGAPDANANDDEALWCDAAESPGEVNPPCA